MAAPDEYAENGYCNVCLFGFASEKLVFKKALCQEGIGFGNIYPIASSEQPGSKSSLKAHVGETVGRTLSCSVVNLPLFPYMTESGLERVVTAVQKGLRK